MNDMKEGWEIKKLGEVCEVEYGTRVVNKRDGGTVYPVYGGGGATFNMDTFNREDCLIVARFAMSEQCTRFVKGKFFLNDSGLSVKPKNTKELSQDFLNLQILFLNDYIYSLARGAAQKNLDVPTFRNIEINYPKSLPEQQRIVSILDEAFAGIANAKANTEQNLKNSKELFESLLINLFINGINIKKWNLEKLEKYNKVVVGYVGPISKEYTNDESGILLLSTKNISSNGVNLEKLTRINHQFHNKNKKSQLVPGDILVARHGNSGQSAVIPETIKEAHALNVIIIKKSETLSSEYICFLLNSGVLDKIASSKAGSVQEIINTSIIKDLIIPVPPLKTQQTIVSKLDALSAETKQLENIYERKINDLEELKKSILEKAFRGELKEKNEKLGTLGTRETYGKSPASHRSPKKEIIRK